EACEHAGIQLRLAPAVLCTDNAAMIGLLAEKQFELGAEPAGLAEYIRPSWPITGC
ncbi:MAG TPA: tRNA (adenosine(37)-N6)-threonylcarbamoyltransferase complex transferase subunit TsaD, partial [Verrucomicrobiales bacterium]|nr:tRNA (adenosine(37)-N6)-threonylcarbamoyltransferase complex transferase subunit TsaD [Verrucomicrobiales bacterium]